MTAAATDLTTVKEAPRRSVSIHTAGPTAPGVFPYPKWWSWTERGTLYVLSTSLLCLVIWLVVVADHLGDTPWARLIPGLLGVRPPPPNPQKGKTALTPPPRACSASPPTASPSFSSCATSTAPRATGSGTACGTSSWRAAASRALQCRLRRIRFS